jgi:hypothetical protein
VKPSVDADLGDQANMTQPLRESELEFEQADGVSVLGARYRRHAKLILHDCGTAAISGAILPDAAEFR